VAPTLYQVVVTTPVPFGGVQLSSQDDITACSGSVAFHLTGPGVNAQTNLDYGDGTTDVLDVSFQKGGTYAAQDDHNASASRRTFVASAVAPAGAAATTTGSTTTVSKPAAPAKAATAPVRATLDGDVSTAGKLTLTLQGKPLSSLKAGRYRIVVLDETARSAFTIGRTGQPPTTISDRAFVGRRTVTMSLAPGRWSFYSTPARRSTFVVTA
jgi:hypothetical protein